MGRCLVSSSFTPLLRFSQIPESAQSVPFKLSPQPSHGFYKTVSPKRRRLCTNAVLSRVPQFSKIGAQSTGPIPSAHLLQAVETAAKTGAEVVMDAVNKPQNVTYKGLTDLVTDTDKMSEAAILEVVRKNFGDHLILGEEGGLIGDSSSDYLWCIDPLDGTRNFAHGYPSFAVSVRVLFRGKPAAAAVVEFVGGPMCWNSRIFSAASGGGAFCNGQKVHVSQTDKVEQSLLVTGFGYEHDDPWATNMDLFKDFTDNQPGCQKAWCCRSGHVSCSSRNRRGVLGVLSKTMGYGCWGVLLLEKFGPATEKLKNKKIDFSLWYKPESYYTEL